MKPRGKGKVTSDYTTVDYYNYYKKDGGTLDSKTFNKILKLVGKEILNDITNNKQVILPHGIGILCLRRYEYSPRIVDGKLRGIIDFGATNKLRREYPDEDPSKLKVYYDNDHSLNNIVKIHYSKNMFKLKNKVYYHFMESRTFKRTLAKNLKEKQIDINLIPLYGKVY